MPSRLLSRQDQGIGLYGDSNGGNSLETFSGGRHCLTETVPVQSVGASGTGVRADWTWMSVFLGLRRRATWIAICWRDNRQNQIRNAISQPEQPPRGALDIPMRNRLQTLTFWEGLRQMGQFFWTAGCRRLFAVLMPHQRLFCLDRCWKTRSLMEKSAVTAFKVSLKESTL